MTALDPPPDDFAKLTLVTTEVAPASLLRLASARHLSDDPFRRSALYRFDAPDESFGVSKGERKKRSVAHYKAAAAMRWAKGKKA